MRKSKTALLRIFLLMILAYHLILCAVTFLPAETAKQASHLFFGMEIAADSQIVYMSRLFGMYAAIFGISMGIAAIDPPRYRLLLIFGGILFFARAINNIMMIEYLRSVFHMPLVRIWQCIITLVIFGTSLFVLLPEKE
ncbi:MAG: hypothetical protein PHC68_09510 [Syntrophorhabdaceae bacterium]|jgi:hypothetical protein|nr:hypothetical protein [Syntrophorhabdaceae bacterium]